MDSFTVCIFLHDGWIRVLLVVDGKQQESILALMRFTVLA